MSEKITWKMILDDFIMRHPRLGKEVVHFRPAGYLLIHIWLSDGKKMEYDYFAKKARFVRIPFTDL